MATVSGENYRVWARALWAYLDLAELGGLEIASIFSGLPFNKKSIRCYATISWDDFCVACERLETLAGGPESTQELLADSYHLVIPEFQKLVGNFVSPLHFARLSLQWISPLVYQGCSFSFVECGMNRITLGLRLKPGARPSLTFFRATIGELRALPRHIGLGPAIVEANVGSTYGDYEILLPDSKSVMDRAFHLVRDSLLPLAPQLAEVSNPLTQGTKTTGEANDNAQRLAAAKVKWSLTGRQVEVLRRVAEGCSNKEIAQTLSCAENTVESHVTNLLRKAGLSSRARLIAAYWSKL